MSLKLATRTLAREEKNGLQYVRVRMTKKEEKEKRNSLRFGRNLIKPILTFNNNYQPP